MQRFTFYPASLYRGPNLHLPVIRVMRDGQYLGRRVGRARPTKADAEAQAIKAANSVARMIGAEYQGEAEFRVCVLASVGNGNPVVNAAAAIDEALAPPRPSRPAWFWRLLAGSPRLPVRSQAVLA